MRCPALAELPAPPPGRTGWPWTEESPQLPDRMPDGKPWPRVSIVTPSYNQAQFLEETIRSVLLQGYPDLEYMIIDGGSTDGSVEIIRTYEPWLTYWVSEKDSGQSEAINKGFLRCHGEYVGWINSDDTYRSGVVSRAISHLASRPDVVVVYSDYDLIDEGSKIIARGQAQPFSLAEYVLHDFVPQQTAFIRQTALRAVQGVDPDLHYSMDYDLFLRLALIGQMLRVPGVGGCFRVCRGTKSVSQAPGFLRDNIQILDRFYANPSLSAELLARKQKAYARAYLHGSCRKYGAGLIEDAKRDLAKALSLDGELRDNPERTADLLAGWAGYPVVGDPFRYVLGVFNNLPESAQPLRLCRRKAIARWAMGTCFRAYEQRNWELVRRALFMGVSHDYRWLFNRGVLSIGAQALIGQWAVTHLGWGKA